MADGTIPLLVAIIVLILCSAFFSATETAYTSLNVIKVKSLSVKDEKFKKVLKLYESYDKLLTTILIGNNIVNITASSLSVVLFTKLIKSGVDPTLVSTVVVTVTVLLFGEITPKFVSKSRPEKMAAFTYPVIKFCTYIFYPINLILSGYKIVISKIFKLKEEDQITDEQLITIVNEAEEDGTLKQDESVLIKSAIEFDDLEVKDILVPRINVVAVDKDAPLSEIKKTFDGERYSRLPVYNDNIDSVIGMIHEKDFYRNYQKQGFSIKDIMQDVVFVVEHTKISVLLKKLQAKKIHMAIVLDEYGGTLGIVTMEDIIEELVGEIYDEYDEDVNEIKRLNDNTYLVACSSNLDDFFEKLGIDIGEDEFDANTVGGWVSERLGELPTVGKKFTYKNLSVEVTKSTRKRVIEIKAIVSKQTDEDEK